MSTTINGVSRYNGVSVDTSFEELDNVMSRREVVSCGFVANTSAASQYFAAPCDGKLVAVAVQGSVTSDATKTYTLTITNGASTAMLGTTVYDADPVLTANTVAYPTLTSTAADLVVTTGDIIKVTFTGGTGSGNFSVVMYFEANA
jgi:hypothetical protein